MALTHFSLFSGIGGIDLAAEWAGFTTVGQCEWADYPTKVLEKHWPDVPRWRDIRSVTAESFYERTGLRTVDLISGGFPCQPFSVAGKQKGKRDDRYLWPEMLRVIREIKPTWVLGENVPGILRIAGRTVCEDLECEGYAVTVFNFEAAAVGARHRRERVFFVAHVMDNTISRRWETGIENQTRKNSFQRIFKTASGDVADTESRKSGEQESRNSWWAVESDVGRVANGIPCWLDGYWRVEPNIPRVATGVKNRVDRLKCLGNAVVPQQVYPILAAIAELEIGGL
jgi:DNA (cytosine-5)-methyltransferase 1